MKQYSFVQPSLRRTASERAQDKEGEGEGERPSTNRWLKTSATHGQPVHNTSSTLRRTRNGKTKIKHPLIAFNKSTDSGTVYLSFSK